MKIKAGLVAVFAAALVAGLPALSFSQANETLPSVSQETRAITHVHLAYIKSGDAELDRLSAAGLYGLGKQLYARTGIENFYVSPNEGGGISNAATGQLMPVGLDPAREDISLYSFIYWPIHPDQPPLGKEAVRRLNDYMKGGGFLLIDTRDQSTGGKGKVWLREALKTGLSIPALKKVEGCESPAKEKSCHVLGKAFFLLKDFPGRQAQGDVWVERTEDYRDDGVASVVVGGNDWASVWAVDGEGGYIVSDENAGGAKQREKAYRTGINMVIYALTGNYKDDSVHQPAISKRIDRAP